ncbi:Sugar ABC transporter, sugar-binding protein [Serinicoccus hydrothermalis]|uniref:Sugar ABC transporter, sugar-binding protein n=1 Tax=Serinicoccus hydrothermalis TaxID=1758689 RepID=A0A1B1NF97_9MICO|nr:Sugar ABC transporter, sugar-binding protein [Serinicoccus hydrothermalis]
MATLALGACATGQTQAPEGGTDFAEETASGVLSIMGFGLDDEIGQVRYDLAEEAVPEVDVQLTEGGLDMQQFLSSVAAGEEPGLIRVDRTQVGTLASRGAIMPLTDCVETEEVDTSVFVESALSQVTFDGEVYGIPEFNTVQLTMANQELLDEAGLSVEDVNGSDREAVAEANEQLHESEGGSIEVIGYDSKLPEFLPLWAKAGGADLLSEDGRTAQLDDPAVLEALEWAVGIYDAQGGFGEVKAFRDSADFFGSGNQFASGTLGAMPMEQWYVNVLNEVSPDAPMAFDTVRDGDGEPLAYASGSAWAIPSGSDNPVGACRFAAEMVRTESWMAAAQERVRLREEDGLQFTGLLTGNAEADERIRKELVTPSGEGPWDAAVEALYEANEHTFALPANPADAEFKQAWMDAVNRVLNGQQEPAEALEQAQEEAQEALDEAWSTWDEQEG